MMRAFLGWWSLEGRGSRREFCWIFFPVTAALVAFYWTSATFLPNGTPSAAIAFAAVGYMIASYAVMTAATVRRLHDLGQHAGWLQLLPLLGVAGLSLCDRLAVDWLKSALIALSVAAASGLAAVLACRKGTEGENQFGPDPLAAIGPLEESGP